MGVEISWEMGDCDRREIIGGGKSWEMRDRVGGRSWEMGDCGRS